MKKITLILLLFVTGCGPATIQGLRDNPAGVVAFEVDQPYQTVYRRIVTRAREKFQTRYVPVSGDLFIDSQEANVVVFFEWPVLVIDIKAISASRTKVTTFYAGDMVGNSKKAAENIERWCDNDSR